MELIFWSIVFVVSLFSLIKGADWLVENSEKIALALKISPFIIGVTIVALGTSLPELASSVLAVVKGASEMVTANVVGSNIANILLIVGLSAIATKSFLAVERSLIDIDLPLLAAVTTVFGFVIWDQEINLREGILLLITFLIYVFYTIYEREEKPQEIFPEEKVKEKDQIVEVLPSRIERRKPKEKPEKINFKVFLFLILGILLLGGGANFLVDSVVNLARILKIGISVITIFGVAVGTSLPELIVSVRSAFQKKYEIAIGNVFGSNVFNSLVVAGIPALIKPLFVDKITLSVGFPFMVGATILLIISGITRRISMWEGLMYLTIYFLFLAKLFFLF